MQHDKANLVTIPVYKLKLVKDGELKLNLDRLVSANSIVKLLLYLGFHEKPCEEYHIIYLDCENQITGIEMISMGTVNHAIIHPRDVFKGALQANARSIIIAHSHPSGNAEPGMIDKDVTQRLQSASVMLQIPILDHVIIGSSGAHFSFNEHMLL